MPKFVVLALLATAALVITTNAQTPKPVAVGETAPDFTLMDHRGQQVTLSDSKGKNPVVLVFYRGYW